MARYLLKFSKQDKLRYISHLDLLRLFQRAFKRAQIKLKYSQGFNPHAKIGFALPLSLGFESIGEYMEFETEKTEKPEDLTEALKSVMPPGLGILEIRSLKDTSKTAVAAVLDFASYKTVIYDRRVSDSKSEDICAKLENSLRPFLKQEEIIITKYSKKKRRDIETEIRGLIHSVSSAGIRDNAIILTMMLKTGSRGNLNPESLIEELLKYAGVNRDDVFVKYERTEMFYEDGRNMVPLIEFKG